MNRKKFLRHEQCPECGSKNNLSIFELPDGTLQGFCYTPRCQYNRRKSSYNPSSLPKVEIATSNTSLHNYQDTLNNLQLSSFLVNRGISYDIQKVYGVGEFSGYVYFPYYDTSNYLRGFKYRDAEKNFRWLRNDEDNFNLFGLQAANEVRKSIVIHEGEIDALSGAMMDSRHNHVAIASAQAARRCLTQAQTYLAGYEKIILSFDNDEAGQEAINSCSDLFPGKLYVAKFPQGYKDANEILSAKKPVDFLTMLDSSKKVVPENFLSKEDIVSQVLESIYRTNDLKGIPTGFPTLDKACGGLRGGEIITVSAGTGVGKTRFILQMIYNLARQGHKSLLYPLEMDYKSIFYLLSEKHLRYNWIGADKKPPVEAEMQKCIEFLSKFVIPYNYVGALDIDKLKASIEYTVANEDVKFIFIDHKDAAVMSSDWKDIDKFYSELKRISIQLKVCFVIVSHISRSGSDKEDNKIELNRIRGSQGVAQYSDFVIGLERERDSSDTLVRTLKAHRLFAGFEEFWISHNWETMQIEEIYGSTESKEPIRETDPSSKPLPSIRTSQAGVQAELSTGLPVNQQERQDDLYRSEGVYEGHSHEEDASGQENQSNGRSTATLSKPEPTDQPQEPELNDIRTVGREKRLSLELRDADTGGMEVRVGVAFDLETKGLFVNGKAPDILCASYAYMHGNSLVSGTLLELDTIKRFLMESKLPFIFHNASFDVSVLKAHGLWDESYRYHDTQLMSYVLNPTDECSLDACAKRLGLADDCQKLNHPWEGKYPTEVTNELLIYAEQDAVVTFMVAQKFWEKLEADKELLRLYKQMELPLSELLIEMQLNGMEIDIKQSSAIGADLRIKLAEIEDEIKVKYPAPSVEKFYKREHPELGEAVRDRGGFIYQVPVAWNLNSNDHKAQLLMLDGWVPEKMTATGKPQVSNDILSDLNLPVAKKLQEYAQLNKILTSFIEPLTTLVDGNNRIHTNLNQTVTRTGRLSSSSPNLQNIPAKGEVGKKVRSLFIAPKGKKVVGGDLSAIEMRLFAYYVYTLTGDDRLVKVFASGEDVHQANADEFGLTRDEAKRWLYLTLYGGGANKLAAALGISIKKAQGIMNQVAAKFPALQQAQQVVKDQCRKDGYVKTLFGRKLFYPDICSKDKEARARAERQAFNALLQGSAADIMKILIVKSKDLARKYDAEFVLTVHDELLFYADESNAEQFANELTELWGKQQYMEPIALIGEFQVGTSWKETK